METQKTQNSQSNIEKEKQSWRNQDPWLQTILKSYSNQDSIVLAQNQNYRSMEVPNFKFYWDFSWFDVKNFWNTQHI